MAKEKKNTKQTKNQNQNKNQPPQTRQNGEQGKPGCRTFIRLQGRGKKYLPRGEAGVLRPPVQRGPGLLLPAAAGGPASRPRIPPVRGAPSGSGAQRAPLLKPTARFPQPHRALIGRAGAALPGRGG